MDLQVQPQTYFEGLDFGLQFVELDEHFDLLIWKIHGFEQVRFDGHSAGTNDARVLVQTDSLLHLFFIAHVARLRLSKSLLLLFGLVTIQRFRCYSFGFFADDSDVNGLNHERVRVVEVNVDVIGDRKLFARGRDVLEGARCAGGDLECKVELVLARGHLVTTELEKPLVQFK